MSNQKENKKFGKHLLNKFYLDPNATHINVGSFSAPSRYAEEACQKYREQINFNPDKFFNFKMFSKIKETQILVSKYINANPGNIVFVDNASDGSNSVLKSIIKPKWKVVTFSTVYKRVDRLLDFLKIEKKI